ncbi:hypothetical protein [Streptomyces gilvosporeus]|uniref:Uncharacterized protein n=1 Tax=Streptomyces gilvosporeus TaxID=553510 RepID=A0A1V0TW40_9ACTN|nr:hypothetical protein B1H19_25705 [Streptomyces gilvosporeus]
MASHARPTPRRISRTLLRTAFAVSAAGAALAAGSSAAASAASAPERGPGHPATGSEHPAARADRPVIRVKHPATGSEHASTRADRPAAGAEEVETGSGHLVIRPYRPASRPDATAKGATSGVRNSVAGATGALKNLKLNPLANTGVDPLDNSVGTQVGDFKPVSTKIVTGPLSRGDAPKDLPLVGRAMRFLPG